MDQFVVGVDFGTLSARAVVLRVADGEVCGSGVSVYEHGVLDQALPTGERLPPRWALQVPSDYERSLCEAVRAAVADAGVAGAAVIGIATDFTACTVLPTLADGTPLCELAEFADRPHAYAKLWKHHAAQAQADRLTATAHERGESWIVRYGGRLSAEWELAKALQVLEEDPELYRRTERWVEAADWIVWRLCGRYLRNACATGYKAAFQDGRYPSPEFLASLHPAFGTFVAEKLEQPIGALGDAAGGLTGEMATLLGLTPGIAVAVGNVDAHVCAAAAGAVGPGQMLAIMGTSTCHLMNSDVLHELPGMCGVVDGGIVAGLWGYEAGQSGVGDVFGWLVDHAVPGRVERDAASLGRTVHEHLTALASEQRPGEHGLIALDWLSGNRSLLVDHSLAGAIIGLTLQTTSADIYRALIEATAFGTRMIVDAFDRAGLPVIDFIAGGGLIRNPLVMQIYADVLRRPIHVIGFEHAPAAGAAIHAAVAAGAFRDIGAASAVMSRVERDVWTPGADAAGVYDRLFDLYRTVHDQLGAAPALMHELRNLREEVTRG